MEKRAEIKALHQFGLTGGDISKRLSIPKATVTRLISKFKKEGTMASNRKGRCGRKEKLSERDKMMITRKSKMNPVWTSRQIHVNLPCLPQVTTRTIRNVLLKNNRPARRPIKKQLLTATQIVKRKVWAKEFSTFPHWKRVIFTDETCLELSARTPHFVRRSVGEKLTTSHMVQTIKHPSKVMFWGCFSWHGPGRLHACEGSMNSAAYCDIIRDRIVAQAEDWFPNDGPWYLQQDSAPCHVSKVSMKLLRDLGITVINWPSSSCDMNPIENLWAVLKAKVGEMKPSNKQQLISYTLQVWNHDASIREMCSKLVEGMPDRIKQLMINKGAHTMY